MRFQTAGSPYHTPKEVASAHCSRSMAVLRVGWLNRSEFRCRNAASDDFECGKIRFAAAFWPTLGFGWAVNTTTIGRLILTAPFSRAIQTVQVSNCVSLGVGTFKIVGTQGGIGHQHKAPCLPYQFCMAPQSR